MADKPHARQLAIVHLLRSREWVSSTSLATRFSVSQRTIYRDIEELISSGVPIEAIAGREGGYRLASDQPIDPLTLDAESALRLYVLGVLGQQHDDAVSALPPSEPTETSLYTREAVRRLTQRIFFDTVDWYWKDEGSGHLRSLRFALMTSTAIEIRTRLKGQEHQGAHVVKPYGLVWKAGEWHLIAALSGEPPQRYRLNLIDRLAVTDLRFTYPEDFNLRHWWAEEMEAYGKGDTRVTLHIRPAASEELRRLSLKSSSKVHHLPDGGMTVILYVDRWEWLIPLVTSYGQDVIVEEPEQLRDAIAAHLRLALAAYEAPLAATRVTDDATLPAEYCNDDSRLRSTRGRNPKERLVSERGT